MQSIVLKPGKLGKSHNLTDCKDAEHFCSNCEHCTKQDDQIDHSDRPALCMCVFWQWGWNPRLCVAAPEWRMWMDQSGAGLGAWRLYDRFIDLLLLRARTLQHCQYWILRGSLLHGSGPGAEEESSHFKDFLSEVEFMMTIYFMISYRIEKFHPLTSLKW